MCKLCTIQTADQLCLNQVRFISNLAVYSTDSYLKNYRHISSLCSDFIVFSKNTVKQGGLIQPNMVGRRGLGGVNATSMYLNRVAHSVKQMLGETVRLVSK